MKYIDHLNDRSSPYYREANSLVANLRDDAKIAHGVIRWNSNGAVPPADIVEFAIALGHKVSLEACDAARSRDLSHLVARMRANDRPMNAEELSEARAAHGSGVTLVNVITGRRTRT